MHLRACKCICMKFYRVYKHFHVSFSHVYFFVCLYAFSCVCVRFNVRLCMLLHVFTFVYVHFVRLYMCLCQLLHAYMWVYVSLTEVCVFSSAYYMCYICISMLYNTNPRRASKCTPCPHGTGTLDINIPTTYK